MLPRRSSLGWVERSETHHHHAKKTGFAALYSSSDSHWLLPRLQLAEREQVGRAGLDEAWRLGGRVLGEVELLNAAGALLDLVGGDQDLADVLVHVAEMLAQLEHAIAQTGEIIAEMHHL